MFWYILKKNLELGANREERNDTRRARPLHKLGIPCACTCTLRAQPAPGFAAFISHISLELKKGKKIRPSIQFIVFHEKTNRHDVKRLFLLYQMDPLLILIKDKNIHSFLFIHLTFSTSHFRGKDFSVDSPKTMKKKYNKNPSVITIKHNQC